MKLRIFFRPAIVVALLGGAVSVLWCLAALASGVAHTLLIAAATFYSALFCLSAWALWRIGIVERDFAWETPGRLLILAPHEDDCVISAGGIGARNRRLGGVTRIAYLAPDEKPGMAERRAEEARAAWRLAGVEPGDLRHLDLLPPLFVHDPQRLRTAAATLRSIIDEFKPTAIVMPMFEGGHIQHDMTAALVGTILTPEDRFDVFEAPEYSPYTSLNNTPHRIVALCGRWLLGLVSYYGPPDGIDSRTVLTARLDADDLACKRRMLAAFESQNAPSLVATRSYPDRLVRWDASRLRRHPYEFRHSYLRFALAARRLLPRRLASGLLPVYHGAIGRKEPVTDWAKEWSLDSVPSARPD